MMPRHACRADNDEILGGCRHSQHELDACRPCLTSPTALAAFFYFMLYIANSHTRRADMAAMPRSPAEALGILKRKMLRLPDASAASASIEFDAGHALISRTTPCRDARPVAHSTPRNTVLFSCPFSQNNAR